MTGSKTNLLAVVYNGQLPEKHAMHFSYDLFNSKNTAAIICPRSTLDEYDVVNLASMLIHEAQHSYQWITGSATKIGRRNREVEAYQYESFYLLNYLGLSVYAGECPNTRHGFESLIKSFGENHTAQCMAVNNCAGDFVDAIYPEVVKDWYQNQ